MMQEVRSLLPVFVLVVGGADLPPPVAIHDVVERDSVAIHGEVAHRVRGVDPQRPNMTQIPRVGVPQSESRRCGSFLGPQVAGSARCDFPDEVYAQAFGCTSDQRFSGFVETRTRLPEGGWGEWGSPQGGCVSATGQEAATPAQIGAWLESELRTLRVVPSPLHVQPDRAWTFVHVDAIVYTARDPQVLTAEVLGQSVSVRLQPVEFVWDFGDGSAPIVTTDPGAPYPDHTVSHPYTRLGTFQVSVHTTWAGEFQVAGDPTWRALSTPATTTTTAPPIEIVEARSRLVEDPLPTGR